MSFTASVSKLLPHKSGIALVNKGQCQSVYERNLGREMHGMNIWSRYLARCNFSCRNIKLYIFSGLNRTAWTVANWWNVMWSAEEDFYPYLSNARRQVRHEPKEAFHFECVQSLVQDRCETVVFPRCFTYY